MRERGSGGETQRKHKRRDAVKWTKIHVFPHASSTRGRGCDRLRRQVSWLADHRLPRPSRSLSRLQWHVEESLPLTVAGAAAGSGKALTAFPFASRGGGNRPGQSTAAARRLASCTAGPH